VSKNRLQTKCKQCALCCAEQIVPTWTIGADAYLLLYQDRSPGKFPQAAAPLKLTTFGQTTIVKSLLMFRALAPAIAIFPQVCHAIPFKSSVVETVSTPLFTSLPVVGSKMSAPLEQSSYLTFYCFK